MNPTTEGNGAETSTPAFQADPTVPRAAVHKSTWTRKRVQKRETGSFGNFWRSPNSEG